ncbi:hypothetical protein MOQ72_27160 [Saccharopolyspora sp. K220]|uniref:DUF5983 family protein n=1 Tax=Saccharopolyspora soli TaxID=2926618 RepID=UPI001F5A68BF|nr:hypothetical protein [Saccharopolyspora soli]MCI2421128.1 hypothetical protein [Saccharopolyspora soli]
MSTTEEFSVSDLVVRTFVDLSTAHLSKQACTDLNTYEGVTAHKTEYGWLMYAPEQDADELAEEGDWPPELLPIVKLARANGCAYILFDAGAQSTDRLPTFDW